MAMCPTCNDIGWALAWRWVKRRHAKKAPFKELRRVFRRCPYCAHAGTVRALGKAG